ncbi:MAG: hypothetical protein ICV60_04765 [Pyrinomonadaceae bacterium]|nr:hypothetical protein [Pyrinomonadaceae bacterium]
MSKHKRAGDEKAEVGKSGAPPSGTENEKAVDEKEESRSVPKVSKKDVGEGSRGGGLH